MSTHTEPTLMGKTGSETRVRRLVLPAVTGAYLLPTMEFAVVQDGHGLAVKLSSQSTRSLATELMRLVDAKDPEA